MTRKWNACFWFLLLTPSLLEAQPARSGGHRIFPAHNGAYHTDPSNPAYCARSESFRTGFRSHDRFLIPTLAYQEWQAVFPLRTGTLHILASHFGSRNYREAEADLGFALALGKKSEAGLRIGPARVWIGEGHGQRFFWKGSFGIRSRLSKGMRWELWVSDLHSALRKRPHRELLHPRIAAGVGKRWPGNNSLSLHLLKELERPIAFRTRARITLREKFGVITGLRTPPLKPHIGWVISWDRLFLSFSANWEPLLGITPTCSIIYRSTP